MSPLTLISVTYMRHPHVLGFPISLQSYLFVYLCQDSLLGIATSYGPGSLDSIPAKGGQLYLLYTVHPGSVTHPASYPVCAGSSFSFVKAPGREDDQPSADVRNA
jgi:hypothetical protein